MDTDDTAKPKTLEETDAELAKQFKDPGRIGRPTPKPSAEQSAAAETELLRLYPKPFRIA